MAVIIKVAALEGAVGNGIDGELHPTGLLEPGRPNVQREYAAATHKIGHGAGGGNVQRHRLPAGVAPVVLVPDFAGRQVDFYILYALIQHAGCQQVAPQQKGRIVRINLRVVIIETQGCL